MAFMRFGVSVVNNSFFFACILPFCFSAMIASGSSLDESLFQEWCKIQQHIKAATELLSQKEISQEPFDSVLSILSTPQKTQLFEESVQVPKQSPGVALVGMDPCLYAAMTDEQIYHGSDQEFLDFKLPPAVPIAESAMGVTEEVKTPPLTYLAIITQVNRMAQLQADQPENRPVRQKRASRLEVLSKKPTKNNKHRREN